MLPRSGLCYSMDHIKVTETLDKARQVSDVSSPSLIFYDIEQVGASPLMERTFSMFIPPDQDQHEPDPAHEAHGVNAFAEEPGKAISNFISWINDTHYQETGGDRDVKNAILAAHGNRRVLALKHGHVLVQLGSTILPMSVP